MKQTLLSLIILFSVGCLNAQTKKALDHTAYDEWRTIENQSISPDGKYIQYTLVSHGYADPILILSDSKGNEILKYGRGSSGNFTWDGNHLIFKISPADTTLRRLKRIKTKKDKLPIDTLAILDLTTKSLTKIPHLESLQIPKKWGDWIAYQTVLQPDSTNKKMKKSTDKNGFPLAIRKLSTGEEWILPYTKKYTLSEIGGSIAAFSEGNDSTLTKGVYTFSTQTSGWKSIYAAKGEYATMNWDESGDQLAFVADLDTTKSLVRNPQLFYWSKGATEPQVKANSQSDFMPDQWQVNTYQSIRFSQDGKQLYFGINPPPIKQDTSILDDEIVNVEVWSYNDPRLHTQQKIDAKGDIKKGYLVTWNISTNQFQKIESESIPESIQGNEGNASWSLGINSQPYLQARSWEGFPDYVDLYDIDHVSGTSTLIASKVRTSPRLSPMGHYAIWFSRLDTAWFTYDHRSKKVAQITDNSKVAFYDELNDSPDYPGDYGIMAWSENDQRVLIYDRYDIWSVDPSGKIAPINLTQHGRSRATSYRYIRLDPEERFIVDNQSLLLRAFDESDKSESLLTMNYGKTGLKVLMQGNFHFDNFIKARESKFIIYNQENFVQFPDIWFASGDFKKPIQISRANPQQTQYNWGTAELYNFISLDGKPLEGLLIKPENFDPSKKYPLLVNFYERSSDGLNRHREPSPGRSTLNYSFYASRGYVIFNPDIVYREGYPGESAYNCVMPGVTSLIKEGFIDKDRIGVQGHSWGGYQIAYLVTQTDLFRCAEAGAPVPNMISAYGGIRWWTGLSRMFQYEHTQSRIGGTLWQYPLRYIENSPIFFVDKINTPLLLMHNDADGHVPWYQGIELFVAMRRLGKPSWMLNYQGEPHWPVKLQNRIDFNIRLQQYFDYYLMDAPMPAWMKEGVPAIQVGIDQNLELLDGQ